MTTSNLEDLLPALGDATRKLAILKNDRKELQDNYRKLIARKMIGQSADDKQARVEAILAGKAPPATTHLEAMIESEQNNFDAVEEAIHIQTAHVAKLKREAGRLVCSKLKPQHDKVMNRFASAMLDAHEALVELHKMKLGLMNQEAGFNGLFSVVLPDAFDRPHDKASPLGVFFREAKAAGYISALPAELR